MSETLMLELACTFFLIVIVAGVWVCAGTLKAILDFLKERLD